MEIKKIRDLLKDHNKILIDYSDKFIDTDYIVPLGNNKYTTRASQIFKEIHDKTTEDKYKNVIFLLDISRLIKYNYNFYISLSKTKNIPIYSTHVYFLKNFNNACCFSIDEFETSRKIINNFINNEKELCNVCFETKNTWIDYEFCNICNFRTCIRCIAKTVKTNSNKKCFGCRSYNVKYESIYDQINYIISNNNKNNNN
jgi:hypothetical protein